MTFHMVESIRFEKGNSNANLLKRRSGRAVQDLGCEQGHPRKGRNMRESGRQD